MKNKFTTTELKESKISFNTQAKETNITLEKGIYLSNLKEFKSKDLFIDNGVNLLDSPTNSGKSHYVLNDYINNIKSDEYIILIAPTLVLVDDLSSDDNAYGFKGNFDRKELEKKRILVCVYDKLKDLVKHQDDNFNLKKAHIFIDEAHNIYSSFNYRSKVMIEIDNLLFKKKQYKKLILMSGTFDNTLIEINNIVKVKRDFKITKKCNLIYVAKNKTLRNSCLSLVIDTYKEDNTRLQVIYQKSKPRLEELALTLEKKGIKCLVLTADTKLNEEVQGLLKNNYVDKDIKVLLMTNIGEEGISILNENLYCTHTVGKINSASAEQLGNRGRRVEPVLNVHLKLEDENKIIPIFMDVEKNRSLFLGRTNLFNQGIKNGLFRFEDRHTQDFMNYCTWDNENSLLEFSNLTIAFDVHYNNNKNEENLYRTIFMDNMEKYGWEFESYGTKEDNKFEISKVEITDKDLILEIFEAYTKNRDIKGNKKDFIDTNKELCNIALLDKMYHKFTFISFYIFDDKIIEQIKRMTRQNNTIDRLEEYIKVSILKERNNATKWLFENIEADTLYDNEQLEILTKSYNIESKNDRFRTDKHKEIDVKMFKKIIKKFFITKDVNVNKSKTVEKSYKKFKVVGLIKYANKRENNTKKIIQLKTETIEDLDFLKL